MTNKPLFAPEKKRFGAIIQKAPCAFCVLWRKGKKPGVCMQIKSDVALSQALTLKAVKGKGWRRVSYSAKGYILSKSRDLRRFAPQNDTARAFCIHTLKTLAHMQIERKRRNANYANRANAANF